MSAAEEWNIQTSSRSDAYDAWSRMLSATHLPWSVTELSSDAPAGFSASVRRRHLADLVLVECTCSPNGGVRRDHELAATDGAYLTMLMTLSGHEMVSQGGNVAQLSPGSVVVWDSEQPAEFLVQDTLVKRSLLVPKSALAEVGGRGTLRTGAVLDVSAPAVTLLSRYLDSLSSTLDALPLGALPAARNAAVELLAAALQDIRSDDLCSGPATRSAAQTLIERRLPEPALTPAAIARALGVSTRSLHRAFEDSGESVSSFIRTRRLARARDDLLAGHTVSQAARRWNFTDPSHFSRSFKRHFGINPSDLPARNAGTLVHAPGAVVHRAGQRPGETVVLTAQS
jgi:AraC family transcriptional regulator, positive regulator of tynA and feaB